MKKELTNTDKLVQKIIERQKELDEMSNIIIKSNIKPEPTDNEYTWWEQFRSKSAPLSLSKAV